jgi:mannose-1-phosphate guanylyltransferase/mannose-6-phosphate isomerase
VAISLAAARNAGLAEHDPLLLVLPADHVLLDRAAFSAAVDAAVPAAAAGRLVTFGVVPRSAETGYGYLLRGAEHDGWAELAKFVEKPDAETARRYVESGRYLWNSGMFLFGARTFLQELGKHEPAMVDACARALFAAETDSDFTRLGAAFLECAAKSVDYAVMEKTRRSAVVPLSAGWSDVGSWPALHEILAKDANGNVAIGDVVMHGCRDTYVAANGRLVAAIGLDGAIVVETADAVLVMARERAQDVKQVVDALKSAGRAESQSTPKAS